jgi:tryptophan-rich sensory protein
MIFRFYKLKPLAANINIPYLLWVMFATALHIETCALMVFSY